MAFFNVHALKVSVVVFVLVLIAGTATWYARRPRLETSEFRGKVEKVEGNIIFAAGYYMVDGYPEYANPDHKVQVKIEVLPTTQLVYTFYFNPTPEELAVKSGPYYLKDLRQDTREGSLADLVPGRDIQVFSADSLFNKKKFAAQRIDYLDVEN